MPFQVFLPVLLALLPYPCVAGGASSDRWWCDGSGCNNSDYSYVETVIVILLVIMAVLFEGAHHILEHVADRSYFYGKLQTVVPEPFVRGRSHSSHFASAQMRAPLFKHWVNRLSKEFMVLGFLAFFVFAFRNAGGFDWVVQCYPPDKPHDVKLPKTAEDWLHMVENVHMKLFLGMIIYFLVVLRVVNGCASHVQFWEEMRILRRTGRIGSAYADDVNRLCTDGTDQTRLQRYSRWRMYFVQSVMTWRETRPELYEQTLKKLSMYTGDTPNQRRFHRTLDDVFPFSAYLAYSVRDCCKDTVDVHRTTWAAVLALFTIFAVIQRFTDLILLHFMPIFIVGAFMFIFAVGRLVSCFRERVESEGSLVVHMNLIAQKTEQNLQFMEHGASSTGDIEQGCSSDEGTKNMRKAGFHERYSTELWVFRVLQIVLFVLSYSCARTIGDPNDWRNSPKEVLAVSSAFLVLFLVLGSLLPKHVPNFAALMAMPPYVDSNNVHTFFDVLEEYNTHHEERRTSETKAAGTTPPVFLLGRQHAGASVEEGADSKKPQAQFQVANKSIVDQQSQLSCDVKEMQASLRKMEFVSSGAPDAVNPLCSTAVLNCELGLMRLQLERLERLMLQCQSATSACALPWAITPSRPVREKNDGVIENSGVVEQGTAENKIGQYEVNSDGQDLTFFLDPHSVVPHQVLIGPNAP